MEKRNSITARVSKIWFEVAVASEIVASLFKGMSKFETNPNLNFSEMLD